MATKTSAPLLSRVKSWQLVVLGLTGWCTLYSVALLAWGNTGNLIGNAQGGCFAMTMTLAGLEASRCKKRGTKPADPLQWASLVSTEEINQIIARTMKGNKFRIERCNPQESELGFGVRVINSGRNVVFETARWKDPVIDLSHVQTTETNRKTIRAELAFVVGVGKADVEAQGFVKTCPVKLLVGAELKAMVEADKDAEAKPAAQESATVEPRQPPKAKCKMRRSRFATWWHERIKL